MPAPSETDPRFPSGEWAGFYLQYWMPGRHTVDKHLSWAGGRLTGTGTDRVGAYTIDGTYDPATGKCEWVKQYVGRHAVTYRGMNDGRGIWGVWEIRVLGGLYQDRGGFHIWPKGTDVSEESERTERAVLAVMRQQFGTRRFLPLLWLAVVGALLAYWLLARTGGGF